MPRGTVDFDAEWESVCVTLDVLLGFAFARHVVGADEDADTTAQQEAIAAQAADLSLMALYNRLYALSQAPRARGQPASYARLVSNLGEWALAHVERARNQRWVRCRLRLVVDASYTQTALRCVFACLE